MPKKTLFTREKQISLTLELVQNRMITVFGDNEEWRRYYESELGLWYDGFGFIDKPHRLFCFGDLIWTGYDNGQGERFRIFSVSSKGRIVDGFYFPVHQKKQNRSIFCGKRDIAVGYFKRHGFVPIDLDHSFKGLNPTDKKVKHTILSILDRQAHVRDVHPG